MLRYYMIQLYTFILTFRWLFYKDVTFYINTLLPVGPALAGRIMGKRVVYHYHENAFVKGDILQGTGYDHAEVSTQNHLCLGISSIIPATKKNV